MSPDAATPDAPTPVGGFAYPRGCYGMAGGSSAIPPAMLANPGLVGVMVAADWRDFEAAGDDQFAWDLLDERVADAKAYGKVVIVGVSASAAKAPQWLVDMPSVTKISFADPNPNHGNGQITVVPFWDPTFRAQKLELIRALGAHFASEPAVVGTMTAFANYYTADWGIPPEMIDGGYSYDGMLDIGKEVLETTAEAWPGKAVKLPLGENDPSTDPGKATTQMADDIVAFAQSSSFADRFFAQKNLINTRSPYAADLDGTPPGSNNYLLMRLRDLTPHAGLQMVAAATTGESDRCRQNAHVSPCPPADVMAKSLDIALSYQPVYVELWSSDASNPAFYSLLTNATQQMNQP